jgi:hypothetical protein
MKKREATIKPKKLGADPVKRVPYLVHPIKKSYWLMYIIFFLLLAALGVGLYFLITHFTENFENNESNPTVINHYQNAIVENGNSTNVII